jgi:hypothetical protein
MLQMAEIAAEIIGVGKVLHNAELLSRKCSGEDSDAIRQ